MGEKKHRPDGQPIFECGFDSGYLKHWTAIGRLSHQADNSVLTVSKGYLTTVEKDWTDIEFTFSARTPEETKEVQIWAGFRHFCRDFRYVAGLRGGDNNHMYLARYGAEGQDRFLDIAPLDFKPEKGIWYTLRIVVSGSDMAVYLNDEAQPRLLARDPEAPFSSGGIVLGGGYLPVEYKDICVSEVSSDVLKDVIRYQTPAPVADKEALRRTQVASYRPVVIDEALDERFDIALNGNWLFKPDGGKRGQEAGDWELGDVDLIEGGWHIMDVPNFWVPTRAWLEGERFEGGRFNKGQNDDFHREETLRCERYTFDYEATGAAWYRHTLVLNEVLTDRMLVLHFEGVALISEVYVNGTKLHDNKGMFGPFDVDISNYVIAGENSIVLYVNRLKAGKSIGTGDLGVDSIEDNYSAAWDIIDSAGTSGKNLQVLDDMELPRGFYGGMPGGIWRPVTLTVSSKLKVEECFFKPTLSDATVDVWLNNGLMSDETVDLQYEMTDRDTKEQLCCGVIDNVILKAGVIKKFSFTTEKVTPKLWAPGAPNLYDLRLSIVKENQPVDTLTESVGFRTTGTEGNRVLVNGQPVWIRGANHMPGHIRPNDGALARRFMEMAVSHNVMATRTHCAPWSNTWMDAADETGVLVSYEGTWPWLMLRGNETPPRVAVDIWLDDMERLFRAHRNRPSVFMWTMNNEMKFMIYAAGKALREKGKILNEAMAMVRKNDPSRPVVADSAYFRKVKYLVPRLHLLMNKIDDGDIDDPHIYNSWYENSFYHLAHGEFSKMHALSDRPLITQEASTGYPRAQDGLPTRSYLFDHQTPQSWVGNDAYEHCDPAYFQQRHTMLTKGTFETLRRVEHDRISGVMPFAFETWFYHHHDAEKMRPMKTVKAIETIFQDILATTDLQILHYYAGGTIRTDVVLLNDSKDGSQLNEAQVICEVVSNGMVLASETLEFAVVPNYSKAENILEMKLPGKLPGSKVTAELRLTVTVQGDVKSINDYEIILATKDWVHNDDWTEPAKTYAYMKGDRETENLLDSVGLKAKPIRLKELDQSVDKLIVGRRFSYHAGAVKRLKAYIQSGGEVVLLQPGEKAAKVLPKQIRKYTGDLHEIVTMNIKESDVFDGIEPLELSWFPYKPYEKRKAGLVDAYVPPYSGFMKALHKMLYKPKVPHVATGRYSVDRMDPDVTVLAQTLLPHGYLSGPEEYEKLGGTPLFDVRLGKGKVRVSAIRYDTIDLDPIEGKINFNLLK